MQKDAHRVFQWIMVSSRPLCVEELAEVFAINFDEEMSGIPKFEPRWRDPNAETAVLSACSTLVAIVDHQWYGKIVQFSHFSVKEYLASDRIANKGHVSHFHIFPKPAHTLFAKACLSVLFQLDFSMDKAKVQTFHLAKYAARHWVEHARFEDVSSYIQDGMDLLFDKDKPHFAIWVWVGMPQFGSELWSGPEPSVNRTQVWSKIRHWGRTGPKVQFRVQGEGPNLVNLSGPVRTLNRKVSTNSRLSSCLSSKMTSMHSSPHENKETMPRLSSHSLFG